MIDIDSQLPRPGRTLDLTVAGVCLEFRCDSGLSLAVPAFEYPEFLNHHGAGRRIPVAVECGAHPALPDDAGLVFDTGDGWQLFGQGRDRWLRMPRRAAADGAGRGPCVWQAWWQEPLAQARLWVAPEQVSEGVVHHVVQYPLDQILFTHALLDQDALLLHAAGAVTARGGVAFAGVSGAGKSTITRLLGDGDGIPFLSDDRVVASPRDGGYQLHGTPWAGDARVARPMAAPLHALCFLRQSPTPALSPLAPAQALERLLAIATLPWFDAARIGDALQAAGNLVARVPCFELGFTRDGRDLPALLDALPRAA